MTEPGLDWTPAGCGEDYPEDHVMTEPGLDCDCDCTLQILAKDPEDRVAKGKRCAANEELSGFKAAASRIMTCLGL
eukprot:9326725-Pyramimonas_sp.AAC.1